MKNIKWLYPVLALLVCGAGIWLFQNVFKANDYENRLPAKIRYSTRHRLGFHATRFM